MEVHSYISEKHRRRKKIRIYIFSISAIFIICLVIVGCLWLLIYSPIFRLKNVIVTGNNSVSSSDIISLLEQSALKNHSFPKAVLGFNNILIWPSSISSADLALMPEVQSLTISKNYLNRTITINVKERQPIAIWCFNKSVASAAGSGLVDGGGNGSANNGITNSADVMNGSDCYWFDSDGMIFARALDTQGDLIFSVDDESQNHRGPNQLILPERFASNMVSIISALKDSGVSVQNIVLKDLSMEEVDVSTYNGPGIYFSLRFSADEDEPVLASLMSKSGFSKLQYIDFRVENRAYYK